MTEPTTGTDTTKINTVAKRVGARYIISGQKVWISRIEHSDLMILLAHNTTGRRQKKVLGDIDLYRGLREATGNGMKISPIRNMVGHETYEVFVDNLEISQKFDR